jgi:hypothetical protein
MISDDDSDDGFKLESDGGPLDEGSLSVRTIGTVVPGLAVTIATPNLETIVAGEFDTITIRGGLDKVLGDYPGERGEDSYVWFALVIEVDDPYHQNDSYVLVSLDREALVKLRDLCNRLLTTRPDRLPYVS